MGQQLSNRGIGQVLMAIMLLSSSLLASTQSAWADAPICSLDGGIPDASITSYISGEVRRNAIAFLTISRLQTMRLILTLALC